MPPRDDRPFANVLPQKRERGSEREKKNRNQTNQKLTTMPLAATSGRPVVRSVPLRLLPPRSVLSVCRRRRSVKISQRPLATGYETPLLQRLLSRKEERLIF